MSDRYVVRLKNGGGVSRYLLNGLRPTYVMRGAASIFKTIADAEKFIEGIRLDQFGNFKRPSDFEIELIGGLGI